MTCPLCGEKDHPGKPCYAEWRDKLTDTEFAILMSFVGELDEQEKD